MVGKSTDCAKATSAALEFREYYKKAKGDHSNSLFKRAIKHFGINPYNDQEIETIICSIVGKAQY